MRIPVLLLSLFGLTLACGGGGEGATAVPPPAPVPAWQAPVEFASSGYGDGALLAGDGTGAVMAAWIRTGVDGGGTPYWEQVACRLRADGTWEAPQVLDVSSAINGFQAPVAALDARGKGLVAWFKGAPRSPSTVLRTVPVDLGSATPFGARANALTVDLESAAGLRLATGTDGSALAAWSAVRRDASAGVSFAIVQASRMEPSGTWGAPHSHHLNMYSRQILHAMAGDGRGSYVLDYSTGDDAFVENEAVDYAAGSSSALGIAGWQPVSQSALPVGHPSVWALDAAGNLETWLLYGISGEGDPQLQAWPRARSAAGTWTVGGKVALPLPAQNLALFREAGGQGWVAGLGSHGLWVAPLSGMVPGTPKTILPAPTQTEVMVEARDAAGRPALLWIQRGTGGVHEGIGFSRWDGTTWTAPIILPGTAGKAIQRLSVVAGPSGLLAGWVEAGDRTLQFRTARWQ